MFKKKKQKPVIRSRTGRPSKEELIKVQEAPVGEIQPNMDRLEEPLPLEEEDDVFKPRPPSRDVPHAPQSPLANEPLPEFVPRPLPKTQPLQQPLQQPLPQPQPQPQPLQETIPEPEKDEEDEVIVLAIEYLKKLKQLNRGMQQLAINAQEYTEALEEMVKGDSK